MCAPSSSKCRRVSGSHRVLATITGIVDRLADPLDLGKQGKTVELGHLQVGEHEPIVGVAQPAQASRPSETSWTSRPRPRSCRAFPAGR